MLWILGLLLLVAIVSPNGRQLIGGLLKLAFGAILLLAGCSIV